MRKFYFVILFHFLPLFVKAQTNIYHPLPDSAQWNYYLSSYCGGGSYEYWYSLIMNSDTVINSINYKQITSPGLLVHRPSFCCAPIPCNDSTYYQVYPTLNIIREDTAQKKIYSWNTVINTDELLYDFNLQVGDTVPGLLAGTWLNNVDTVAGIDSMLIGATYRKRFLVNTMYSIYWIEGVGSTYGFFLMSPSIMWDANENHLLCFKANGSIVYNATTTSCDVITNQKEELKSNPVKLFPNPASEFITATWPDNFQPSVCSIKNITGQQISSFSITPGIKNTRIQLNALDPGLYILEFEENTIKYPVRFIRY